MNIKNEIENLENIQINNDDHLFHAGTPDINKKIYASVEEFLILFHFLMIFLLKK